LFGTADQVVKSVDVGCCDSQTIVLCVSSQVSHDQTRRLQRACISSRTKLSVPRQRYRLTKGKKVKLAHLI